MSVFWMKFANFFYLSFIHLHNHSNFSGLIIKTSLFIQRIYWIKNASSSKMLAMGERKKCCTCIQLPTLKTDDMTFNQWKNCIKLVIKIVLFDWKVLQWPSYSFNKKTIGAVFIRYLFFSFKWMCEHIHQQIRTVAL